MTKFTRLSVHCAERITATKSSKGERKFNSQLGFGNILSSSFEINFARVITISSRIIIPHFPIRCQIVSNQLVEKLAHYQFVHLKIDIIDNF